MFFYFKNLGKKIKFLFWDNDWDGIHVVYGKTVDTKFKLQIKVIGPI